MNKLKSKVENVGRSGAPKGLYKGTNFITPEILRYYKCGQAYAEISRGDRIGEPGYMYGVTFKDARDPDRDLYDVSTSCYSEEEAMKYIAHHLPEIAQPIS